MEFAAHLPLLSHGNANQIPPVRMAVTVGDGVPGALGMLFSVPVCSVFFSIQKTRPKAVVAALGREERKEAEHQLPA